MWEFVFWESRRVKHLNRGEYCESVKVFYLPTCFSFHRDRGVMLINDRDRTCENPLVHRSKHHEGHEVEVKEDEKIDNLNSVAA